VKALEVGAGLVFRGGKLLITLRHDDVHLGGLWEFPGGKKEPHETYEDCVVRELCEELGIDVRVGELIESATHEYPEKSVHLRFFRCEWLGNEPRALGCADLRWVTREEIGGYEFPAADLALLERLKSERALWR
jgi:mutator protein MutT